MKHRACALSVLATSVLLLACAASAHAAEIVVQNDSVTDFGQAVIVGDFIAGEQAGVRLTSPITGTIVAVQILWLEGSAGHPQSLEEAIHIYAGTSFPTPGAQWALLEGPVLSPGYLNEFRYLDEAGQIPLSVPVSAGQQFYVSLEFANPTDVGGGGPSVVRDLSGCQSGKNVIYAYYLGMWGWYNFCLITSGDFAIRAVIAAPEATGACCQADGLCVDGVAQNRCTDYGSVWYEGQTCSQITCTRRGACCRQTGCVQLVEPAACAAIGGQYAGDGSDCNDSVCIAGACCFGDGTCSSLREFQCTAQGGTFRGIGTTCSPNPCPQPTGACCFDAICLSGQTQANCAGAGGIWVGAATTCTPNPCNVPPPACPGDSNCDGTRDFDDIRFFVTAIGGEAAWLAKFATPPTCGYLGVNDCNGDGIVSFDDIKPFVSTIGVNCP